MLIGVDATCWFNERGYGRFARELLRELVTVGARHRYLLYVDSPHRDRIDLGGTRVEVVEVNVDRSPTAEASARGYRSPRDLLRFTGAVRKSRPDLVFFPSVYTFFPVPRRVRAVVTVHDAIPERFPKVVFPTRRARLFWRAKVYLALRQSRLVLTVSDYSASELTTHLGIPGERIRVSGEAPSSVYREDPEPSDFADAERVSGLPAGGDWFTYVGGLNPHKRLDVLVRAHARLAREHDPAPHLLLVGSYDRDVFHGCREEIEALIRAEGTESMVHWTGYVPDRTLRALHAGSIACVLPSESEGFGLPAVEAAACGAAVVATTESPLPALLDGGGEFVEPGDPDRLAGAMGRLLRDGERRRALGARGRERTRALSWRAAAERTLAALEEAAA